MYMKKTSQRVKTVKILKVKAHAICNLHLCNNSAPVGYSNHVSNEMS